MLLNPKKTKFSKCRKGKYGGIDNRSSKISFGTYGLKALDAGRITARQIEAARKTIKRRLKRQGELWIRIFPDIPVSSKPAEVRMGKGKGSINFWISRISVGKVLFELSGVSFELAKEAFQLAANKLPIRTGFITKL